MRPITATLCVALLTLLAAAVPAYAAKPGANHEQRLVEYSDLDLSRIEDAQELYRRVTRAAGEICDINRVPLVLMGEARACRDDAIARALARFLQDRLYDLEVSS